jgi:integrase
MKGYVVRKNNQHYAVIYEGLDPITGRERRRWHPAGADRAQAEALANELAVERMRDWSPRRSSLTVGVYLTQRWLPGKRAALRPSTWDSYRRNVELHIVPRIGRVPLRHLRPDHVERLYAGLLADGNNVREGGLDAKTVLEIHMVLRRALDDAVRRGMIASNPAAVAHAPKRRPLSSATLHAWNAQQLRAFLVVAADHRFHAALWVSANTGMRRGELLGLHWGDVELDAARVSINRSLVSVGYELHESRGKTRTSRRCIDLDQRTVDVLRNWRSFREHEDESFDTSDDDAYVFARPDGAPTHPHLLSDAFKKMVKRSALPRIRLHDLRHTHATLLLKAGVPIKVVSERLGHSTPGFTMATYQHVLPGMQAEAARTFASLLADPPDSTR